MDQSASDTDDHQDKKGRGSTLLSNILKSDDSTKKIVEYNSLGQPIGPISIKLASYLGALARQFVPINIENWHKVSNELKEKLWIMVQENFVVDPKSKKKVISDVGVKWRAFKTYLNTNYIASNKNMSECLKNPPKIYNFIDQTIWEEFVNSRLTEEFQKVRENQLQRQSKNLYNHRISRKGYAKLVEEMKKNGEIIPDQEFDRSIIWKKARVDKNGVYVNDATKNKADRIDELFKQIEDGTISTEGSSDLLTKALETPEHSGRVRAMGHFVTPTVFFNIPRRRSNLYVTHLEQKHTILELQSRIASQDQRLAQLESQIKQLSQQGLHISSTESEKIGSNTKESQVETDRNSQHKNTPIDLSPLFPQKAKEKVVSGMLPSDPNPKGRQNAMKNNSLQRATLEQKKADENVLRLAEDQKREKEDLHKRIIQLEQQLDAKQALELEIERLKGNLNVMKHMGGDEDLENKKKMEEMLRNLKDKEGELEDMEALNQALIVKECKSNDEVQEARKELINALKDRETSKASSIGIKRLGELDSMSFLDASKRKYSAGEAGKKSLVLCSLWEEHLRDPERHPFKIIKVGDKHQEIINEDEKLKGMKEQLGDEVYEAVTALLEMNE